MRSHPNTTVKSSSCSMYFYGITVLFILCIGKVNAQEQNLNKKKLVQENRKNIIKITPFKILDFTNPSIETAYERKASNRFSTQLMLSKLLSIDLYDSGVRNVNG